MDERPPVPAVIPHRSPRSKWPQLLALSAHEFRSPLTVVAGYIRMLLQDRAGPLSDQQRRLARGGGEIVRTPVARPRRAQRALAARVGHGPLQSRHGEPARRSSRRSSTPCLSCPTAPSRSRSIADGASSVHGDAVRLRTAFSSILHALRRELVTSDELVVRVETQDDDGVPALRIAIGEPSRIARLLHAEPSALVVFDEWRGGNGLSLPNARRIIEAHGGRVWSLPEAGQADDRPARSWCYRQPDSSCAAPRIARTVQMCPDTVRFQSAMSARCLESRHARHQSRVTVLSRQTGQNPSVFAV